MPNIKSAEKRVMVSKRNQLRNRAAKTNVKTALKKFDAAEDKVSALAAASSAVDKAVVKGVFHKNKANRKKAQLAKAAAKA